MFSISSSSIIITWFIIELNLMSFVGIILFSSGKEIKLIAIKYFTFQVNASAVLFLLILFKSLSMVKLETIIILVLISKLGIAPIHMWFIRILSKLEWNIFLWISIPQKLIPLIIISVLSEIGWSILLIVSTIVSTVYGIAQVKIKKVLGASSVFRLNWLFLAMLINTNLWIIFFLVYSTIKLTLIISLLAIQKRIRYGSLAVLKLVSVMSIIGLAGIPPRPIFFIKLDVFINGASIIIPFTILVVIICSLIILYIYINTIIRLMILSTSDYKITLISNLGLFYLLLLVAYIRIFITIFN